MDIIACVRDLMVGSGCRRADAHGHDGSLLLARPKTSASSPFDAARSVTRSWRLQVNRIPIVHGSALFQLGSTQSLATATVGSPDDEQRMQGLLDADSRRLIVHFAFPPYAPTNVRHCATHTVILAGQSRACSTFAYAAAACYTFWPRSTSRIAC
jgi:hypothetical protein